MSHVPQRKEKDCLNCGTIVQGRYCHVCGQENVVPKETFWHVVTHFFYDVTHFDSSFFTTVKDLIWMPGFLSAEYNAGRRVNYLHPIRMYVFTSAVFFLILFKTTHPEEAVNKGMSQPIDSKGRAAYVQRLQDKLRDHPDSKKLQDALLIAKDTSRVLTPRDLIEDEEEKGLRLTFTNSKYTSEQQYDSMEAKLPPERRDNWFMRRLVKKEIDLNKRYKENPEEALNKVGESLLHRIPYMLFVSLPLFALILKLVYVRRKQYYFIDHGIFTIHLYVFTFLVLMLIFAIQKLDDLFNLSYAGLLIALCVGGLYFYLYKAMRYFYKQRRGKTIIKFFIVCFASLILFVILFAIFMFFSAYTL